MKKPCKLQSLVSKPLLRRWLVATPVERDALRPVVEKEADWRIRRREHKGWVLEARVAEVFGLFTRGQGRGTIHLLAGGPQ